MAVEIRLEGAPVPIRVKLHGGSLVSFEIATDHDPDAAARHVRRWLAKYQREHPRERRAFFRGYVSTYVDAYAPALRHAWPRLTRARGRERAAILFDTLGFSDRAALRRPRFRALLRELDAMTTRLPATPERVAVRVLAAVRGVSVRLVEREYAKP